MNNRPNTLAVFGCAALLVGTLLACKKKEEPSIDPATTPAAGTATATAAAAPPVTKTFNVGETATQPDYALTVHAVKECTPKSFERAGLNKDKQMLLGVEVTVQSNTSKSFSANSFNMKLVDGEGLAITSQTFGDNCGPRFSSAQLNQGEKVKGWVIWKVAKDTKNLTLSYEPLSFLGPKQLTKFSLGR